MSTFPKLLDYKNHDQDILYEVLEVILKLKSEIGMLKEECSMASLPRCSVVETSGT